MYNKIWKN